MIDRLPRRVVVLSILGFVLALGALGALSIGEVTSPPVFVVALLLGLVSVVLVVRPWPSGREQLLAALVVTAVVVLGLLVVAVLPAGRPGYALWFPAFVWIPLGGLALRGRPVHALVGAALSAATTLGWALAHEEVGIEDGLYRVVSPTAAVVLLVAVDRLVRQYGHAVERARTEQIEAARDRKSVG